MGAERFKKDIFLVDNRNFNELAVEIFHFQVKTNTVYSKYIQLLGINASSIRKIENIPFLPISFFKNHQVVSSKISTKPAQIFESSSTTGKQTSKHHIIDLDFYLKVCQTNFEAHYGAIKDLCMLALLPGYLERQNSSLVFMANHFIQQSQYEQSGFYLTELEALKTQLLNNKRLNIPTLLFGVSFALLDLIESLHIESKNLMIMETGGMKGKRKELTRSELHQSLTTAFSVQEIHSEYGMTELHSQAYSKGNGRFVCPPWMKVLVRDTSDPFQIIGHNKTGGLNIIDLANIESCAFISTSDLGRSHSDGAFEMLGRFDHSDIRGCNLLYA
jgi:hypothetical protein